jgi:hypothetical protein
MRGQRHDVYGAIRADGSCPACGFLAALKSRNLPGDTDDADAGLEPDERLSDYDWFLDTIKLFANDGEPPYARAMNYLRAGIWEFKHGSKRLTFYDTKGAGLYTEKEEIVRYEDAEEPDSRHWRIPNFDHELRLGHWFLKQGQKAMEQDLSEAEKVREEDLSYDIEQ